MIQTRNKILVSDFDGTMTRRDFFWVALDRMPAGTIEPWERYEQGLNSHFAALAEIFAGLRIDGQGLDAILAEMQLDSDLAEGVERLQQSGWSLVIASAGCEFYIQRMLRQTGVKVVVHANPGSFIPGQGLYMEPPLQSPFYTAATGIDKAAVVRCYLHQDIEVAFAGDGRPDLAPALLVPPAYRFARGWLADELERLGEPYVRFDRWSEITERLSGGGAA